MMFPVETCINIGYCAQVNFPNRHLEQFLPGRAAGAIKPDLLQHDVLVQIDSVEAESTNGMSYLNTEVEMLYERNIEEEPTQHM